MFLSTLAKHVNNNSLVNLAALSTVEKSPFFKPFPFSLPPPPFGQNTKHTLCECGIPGEMKKRPPPSHSPERIFYPLLLLPDEGGREGRGGRRRGKRISLDHALRACVTYRVMQ